MNIQADGGGHLGFWVFKLEPGAAADGGGHLGFWVFKLAVAPAAAELGRSASESVLGEAFLHRCRVIDV